MGAPHARDQIQKYVAVVCGGLHVVGVEALKRLQIPGLIDEASRPSQLDPLPPDTVGSRQLTELRPMPRDHPVPRRLQS